MATAQDNHEDYNLHGRILDNLEFFNEAPFDILIDSSRVIQNADVCFDQETNDFYVVYEALNPDSNRDVYLYIR
ncbi:MAG: hypothetical protein P9L92_13825 [Candidatus Electryonea clarkiae]|nr:hypothetical protein [Candidatus Electryonea clarkiae]MDP8288502.1 hypothetical protein [Candidatus Electryonea clarkiae]